MLSLKTKIFPLIVLLLATTLNSFSGLKKSVLSDHTSISRQKSASSPTKQADAEKQQNTEEQESDDKDDRAEDADNFFVSEQISESYISNQVSHIYHFQIALYREHHRVIFSPPPEA